ncbi:MAG: beta-galactosidase [Planctomycetota bacterium]
MLLGAQYYRAPFPARRYWREDLERMRDAGLDTVQFWVLWAWVEPEPGRFVFDDYDELIELARAVGLQVVLSTIAEIQPLWIHREESDCALVTARGQRVVSTARRECHFGLTPGGCTDHPGVWERMARFLATTAGRYAGVGHLVAWDAWNELRWNVAAEDLVCYCPHTLAAFHAFLGERFGSLDALNAAWSRRYACWEDVRPGRTPGHPFTEHMAFMHFLTERANRHAAARCRLIRAHDPGRPVTLHGGDPSPLYAGNRGRLQCLDRGNDWAFAETFDGIGVSSFPRWFAMDDATFAARLEYARGAVAGQAARRPALWLSELQGGRSVRGFELFAPVDGRSQQRWVWQGIARGATAVLFWCWRDEVFGREAGGFGLIGDDGHAAARLAAMRTTRQLLDRHRQLLAAYTPASARLGVWFGPWSYYHVWSMDGSARLAADALAGYCRALLHAGLPYLVVEEEHLDVLAQLDLLILPRASVLSPAARRRLTAFVERGGTLVCEAECGAWTTDGILLPPEERFCAGLAGVHELGRRELVDPLVVSWQGTQLALDATQWSVPVRCARGGTSHADHPEGSLVAEVAVKAGRVVALGGHLGEAYLRSGNPALERLLRLIAEAAGLRPAVAMVEQTGALERGGTGASPEAPAFVDLCHGHADGRLLVFAFPPAGCTRLCVRLAPGLASGERFVDLASGAMRVATPEADGALVLTLDPPDAGYLVLGELRTGEAGLPD